MKLLLKKTETIQIKPLQSQQFLLPRETGNEFKSDKKSLILGLILVKGNDQVGRNYKMFEYQQLQLSKISWFTLTYAEYSRLNWKHTQHGKSITPYLNNRTIMHSLLVKSESRFFW